MTEALEAFRHKDKENFIEEMADVIIRVLDCTEGLDMNIGEAIIKKLEKNKSTFEEKTAYNIEFNKENKANDIGTSLAKDVSYHYRSDLKH